MSHFTVVVIGENIDEQLAPYAEQDFEEQYAQFEDTEDASLGEYNTKEVEIVVLTDGSLHSKYDQQFRHFDPKKFNSDYVYPEGSVVRKGNFSELYPTFEDFMEKWHGMSSRDVKTGRYGHWHNPNAKFDYYVVGGRWTGYFKPKAGAVGNQPRDGWGKFNYYLLPIFVGNQPRDGWVDNIKLKDIDVEAMQADAVKEANETYDKLDEVLQGRALPSWNKVRESHGDNIEAARQEYHSLEVVQDLNKAQFHAWGDLEELFGPNREAYVERCKNAVMVPYAFVKDGKWYQKGEMGWFSMSSDEMTQDEWNQQFWEMISTLDPNTELTLVDCHI